MIDYALALTAIAIFAATRGRDSFVVACAFVAVLSVFELFEFSQAQYDLAGAPLFCIDGLHMVGRVSLYPRETAFLWACVDGALCWRLRCGGCLYAIWVRFPPLFFSSYILML